MNFNRTKFTGANIIPLWLDAWEYPKSLKNQLSEWDLAASISQEVPQALDEHVPEFLAVDPGNYHSNQEW